MKFTTLALSSLMLLAAASTPATAGVFVYNIVLGGNQSVAANASTASGTASVTVDDVANTVSVVLNFSGLTGGNASAAHIHCCVATTANGPVIIPLTNFPLTTSGTYSNTFPNVSILNIAGIKGGLAYINIHNAGFGGGEIRGDIVTPEPATLSLLGLGALVMVGVGARRKRQSIR